MPSNPDIPAAALKVAQLAFPGLPLEAGLEALAQVFGRPLSELSDEELDDYQRREMLQQRARLDQQ